MHTVNGDGSKTRKNHKKALLTIAWVSMLVWLIVPFYIYICCLLPDLNRISCHSLQRMPLKLNTRH